MTDAEPLRHNPVCHTRGTRQPVLVKVSLCVALALALISCSERPAENSEDIAKPLHNASAPGAAMASMPGPKWQELTKAQQQVLKPLTHTWDSLGSVSKNKWITIAASYPTRTPAEQQRLQERMVEWAALSSADRERARLNFAGTKKLSPAERAADWEAYQGLSSQEKRAFANVGNGKPVGAAVAVTPVSPDKLMSVPVTRRTPANDDAMAVIRPSLNPKTLLPAPIIPPDPVPASVAEPASVPDAASENVPPDKRLTIN